MKKSAQPIASVEVEKPKAKRLRRNAGRPTHRLIATGELVFGQDYETDEVEEIPSGFWPPDPEQLQGFTEFVAACAQLETEAPADEPHVIDPVPVAPVDAGTAADPRPEFVHVPTGAIVFGDGYDPAELEPVADDYWRACDLEERRRAIKAEAEARILEIAPIWRQVNDLAEPDTDGARERRRAIDDVRDWSNRAEAELEKRL